MIPVFFFPLPIIERHQLTFGRLLRIVTADEQQNPAYWDKKFGLKVPYADGSESDSDDDTRYLAMDSDRASGAEDDAGNKGPTTTLPAAPTAAASGDYRTVVANGLISVAQAVNDLARAKLVAESRGKQSGAAGGGTAEDVSLSYYLQLSIFGMF